jgi:acetoacetate decarboxylase
LIGSAPGFEWGASMNDTAGFGDFTECVRVIPIGFQGESGIFVHSTYPDNEAPIAGGREIQGFSWKLARPKFCHESGVLAGTLYFGPALPAAGTMGYTHEELDPGPALRELACPSFLIKIVPHLNGGQRFCKLVRYRRQQDVRLKGAWNGPAALHYLPMRWAMLQNFRS